MTAGGGAGEGALPAGVERDVVAMESPGARRAGAGGYPCHGCYTRPAGSRPRTAFIATHYNVDFSTHYLSTHLAQRGFGFLGWNTRYRGADHYFLLDRALVDIGAGVGWLRRHGVDTVVLLGNSGGGSLMAAYHAQSQGEVVTQGYGPPLLPEVATLPAADLYVSVAAHPGRPEVLTAWLDPSVTDEDDPLSVDPELDLYRPGLRPPLPTGFVERYRAAQVARNQRITEWAKAALAAARAGAPSQPDRAPGPDRPPVTDRPPLTDRLFLTHRTWADPRFVDPSLDPSERPTPACYRGDPRRANYGVAGVGNINTLRSWLSMWSLETSQCRSDLHLSALRLPTLVIQPTADTGVFPSDADRIFQAVAAGDKQRVDLPGDHYFADPPGARAEVAEVIAAWTRRREG
ncbi:MAG TPA: hypothetical protein VKU91_02815 [Acidimicrobiales bacterium]|nr:hypothetical protein [Acidimicrobiales bacterium]